MRIPIAREGWPFIIISLAPVIIVWAARLYWLEAFFAPLMVFVVAFFRDPERAIPGGNDSIVSPADGKVIKAERVREDRLLKGEAIKISIFMNVFNVHVNRAPASGRVVSVAYNPGKFLNASFDKASLENEQNGLVMETDSERRFAFNQIAGLIARRIVCHAKPGMRLEKGQRFGMIRFGSRLDVYLPVDCRISVKIGDKVSAGESILGYWNVR